MAILQQHCDPDSPKTFAAWVAEAGVPDPRPIQGLPNLPLIPPQSAYAFSEQLWDLGFRHHPDLQKKWVVPGGFGEAGRTTTRKPKQQKQAAAAKKSKKGKKGKELMPGTGITMEVAEEMVDDQYPDIQQKVFEARHGSKADRAKAGEEMLATVRLLSEKSKEFRIPEPVEEDSGARRDT